jgi:hypothetical protein
MPEKKLGLENKMLEAAGCNEDKVSEDNEEKMTSFFRFFLFLSFFFYLLQFKLKIVVSDINGDGRQEK